MRLSLLTQSLAVGVDTLRANPLRTLLSTLGIVIGVASLVSVLSVADGMERFARQQISSTTDVQQITVTPRTFRFVDGAPVPEPNPVSFARADADSLHRAVGDSVRVNILQRGIAIVTVRGDTTQHGAQLLGMLFPAAPLADSMLFAGRVFTNDEGVRGAPVAVISYQLAEDYTKGRAAKSIVGDTLLFQGEPRLVIGVMKPTEAEREQRTRRAFLPADAVPVAGAFGALAGPGRPAPGGSGTLAVTAPSVDSLTVVRQRIERWAARRYGSAWKNRVNIQMDQARVEQLQNALLIFKLFMGALTGISLVVGGIGIMNVLLSSVVERTREIGIRKATGASQRDILWQFLTESVTITGAGSVVGLLLGILVAVAVAAIMRASANAPRLHAWLSLSTVLVAVVASVAVGLTFGLYPALRAARLAPIEAIHHE